jgi:hypothetical protein
VSESIRDPYAGEPGPRGDARREPRPAAGSRSLLVAALVLTSTAAIGAGWIAVTGALKPPPITTNVVVEKHTPTLLVAVKDVARLETAEVQVEKVLDLTDRQSRLFGLVESKDALLLVAVGHASLGVDLGKLKEGDVTLDETTKIAKMTLPQPEVWGAALDEDKTYVYSRETDLLAKRNEKLETSARRSAVKAIEEAAATDEMKDKARKNAERQLSALAKSLGAKDVVFTWK